MSLDIAHLSQSRLIQNANPDITVYHTTHQNRPVAPKMDPISEKQPPRRRHSSGPASSQGSATPAVPEFKSSQTKWMHACRPLGDPLRGVRALWRLANGPPGTGSSACFIPSAPLSPPLTHRDREPLFIVITNGGVGNRWAREIRWPFPGCRSAQPLNGCGRGGGGEVQKHIGVVFFCMFWVSSVCSSCCFVDEIDRDKQTTGTISSFISTSGPGPGPTTLSFRSS